MSVPHRLDFAGNVFEVERNLTQCEAERQVAQYESHGHHQHYWAKRIPPKPVDYNTWLNELIAKGSPLSLAIRVLIHQGASREMLVDAVATNRSIGHVEAGELVDHSIGS